MSYLTWSDKDQVLFTLGSIWHIYSGFDLAREVTSTGVELCHIEKLFWEILFRVTVENVLRESGVTMKTCLYEGANLADLAPIKRSSL